MKKYILAILSLAVCLVSGEADAVSRRYIPKPYIGFDYIYTNLDYKGNYDQYFEDSDNTYGINLGLRMTEYMGMELYYQYARESKRVTPEFTSKGRFSSYSLDFIGYIPSDDLSFSMLLLVGAGVYEYRGEIHTLNTRRKDSESYLSLRTGLGLQYNFTRAIALRAIGRYVMPPSDYVRYHLEGSIGIQLAF